MEKLIEKVQSMIEASDMPRINKSYMKGFVERSYEANKQQANDFLLISEVGREKYLSDIIVSTDEVKIYRLINSKEEWDNKYPYRCIFKNKNGKWERSSTVSPSLDTALLVYLDKKHLGANSQFADFALKMLEIKIED